MWNEIKNDESLRKRLGGKRTHTFPTKVTNNKRVETIRDSMTKTLDSQNKMTHRTCITIALWWLFSGPVTTDDTDNIRIILFLHCPVKTSTHVFMRNQFVHTRIIHIYVLIHTYIYKSSTQTFLQLCRNILKCTLTWCML